MLARKIPAALALSALALTGCSSPAPVAAPAPAPSTSAPAPEPTPEPALECLEAPVLDRLDFGAVEGSGFEALEAAAYRSPNHEEVYLVAARFAMTGADPEVGVWATNVLDGPGMIMAVDGMAQEFTVYPHADETDAQINAASPGVDEALECLAS